MLLNPNRIENPQQVSPGSVEAQDPFDHPIPGQSLTEEPGKHAFAITSSTASSTLVIFGGFSNACFPGSSVKD